MIAYADSSGCYRATLLGYFGEREAAPACGFCGNCVRRRALSPEDLLRLRKILSGVARGGERWGKRKVVAMLTGDLEGLPEPLLRLSTTGILAGESARAVGAWIDAAQGGGLLAATDDVYRTLSLTRAGREVMAGRATEVALTLPQPARPRDEAQETVEDLPAPAPGPGDSARVQALREWRRLEAARRSVPAYVVLHDRTLAALAAARPSTLDALSEIPGIGPAKLEAYGKDLARALRRGGRVVTAPGRVVYSSGKGRVCPACGWPENDCHCAKTLAAGAEPVPETVTVKLRLETRASGKHVTVLDGLPDNRRVSRDAVPGAQEGVRDGRRRRRRRDRAAGRPARAAAGPARPERHEGEGMTATRVYLVRHGATPLTAEDAFAGETDVPLSDAGREQLRKLAVRLSGEPITAVYASPLGRTMETRQDPRRAAPAARHGEGGAARDLARSLGGQDARLRPEGVSAGVRSLAGGPFLLRAAGRRDRARGHGARSAGASRNRRRAPRASTSSPRRTRRRSGSSSARSSASICAATGITSTRARRR